MKPRRPRFTMIMEYMFMYFGFLSMITAIVYNLLKN